MACLSTVHPDPQPAVSTQSSPGPGEGELTVRHVLAAARVGEPGLALAARLPSRGFTAVGPLSAMVNLRVLDLSCNSIACLLPLAGLPALRELCLQGNCIRDIAAAGAAAGSFPCLEVLDLSFCALAPTALAFLGQLPRLRHLDISGNALASLGGGHSGGGLRGFQALRSLRAASNDLGGGALAALGALPLLQQLDLSRCKVAAVSWGSALQEAVFPRLQVLDLCFNSITSAAAVRQLRTLPSQPRLLLLGNPVAQRGQEGAGIPASSASGCRRTTRGGCSLSGSGGCGGSAAMPARPSLSQQLLVLNIEEVPPSAVTRARALAAAAARACALRHPQLPSGAGAGGSQPSPDQGAAEGECAPEAEAGPCSVAVVAEAGEGGQLEEHVPAELLLGGSATDSQQSLGAAESGASAQGSLGVSVGIQEEAAVAGLAVGAAEEETLQQQEEEGEQQEEESNWAEGLLVEGCLVGEASGRETGGGSSQEEQAVAGLAPGSPAAPHWDNDLWDNSFAESEGSEEGWGVEDPTIRLALALGLDPLRLAWLSPLGSGCCAGSSPVAAVNALKFALAHPPTAPAGGPAGNHLKGTASTAAKRRTKFGAQVEVVEGGAAAAGPGGRVGRLAAIDALLAAMRQRLRKVEARIKQDIGAAFDLVGEEGPAAGTNTAVAPTPVPGPSSASDEAHAGRLSSQGPSAGRLSSFGQSSASRLSHMGQSVDRVPSRGHSTAAASSVLVAAQVV